MEPVPAEYAPDVPTIEPELKTQVQTPEQLPFTRCETIFIMIGVLFVVFLSVESRYVVPGLLLRSLRKSYRGSALSCGSDAHVKKL